MAKSSPLDFVAKWHLRFAPNTTFEIAEVDFQEFATDIADSFGVRVENVPEYAPGTTYATGYLVRFTPAGSQEAFYYALQAGQLPAPVAVGTDPNWKVVPGPVPATQLGQFITLAQARNINGDSVVLGRDYAIELPQPSASGHQQLLSLAGIAENWFASEGYLVVNNVRTPIYEVDLHAQPDPTWQMKQYGAASGTVKSVNGQGPDAQGDVQVPLPTVQVDGTSLVSTNGVLSAVAETFLVVTFPTGGAQLQEIRIGHPAQVGLLNLVQNSPNVTPYDVKVNGVKVTSYPCRVALGDKLSVEATVPVGGGVAVLQRVGP